MAKKILYIASTVGHLKSFHLPYLERLSREGYLVHTAGKGADEPLPGAALGFDIPFEKSMFSPKNLAATRQLAVLLRREQYDAVSVHTSLAAFFTRLALRLSGAKQTRLINTVHGYLFDADTPFVKRNILLWAEKLTAGQTDLLLTMNRQDTDIANTHRLSSGPIIQTNGMGVRFERFTPVGTEQRRQTRARFGLSPDAFVLVYAAEFSGRKNQSDLIRALTQLPERVVLLLAGRGDTQEECRSLAEQLGVAHRVIFAGFVPDVESCYHAADLCVSSSRSEGLPFNLMEAMHCALPVVATHVKGHEDLIVHGENGYLFPFGDLNALCGHITALMDNPDLLTAMGEKSRELVLPYGLNPVLEENMALLQSFLGEEKVPVTL